MKKLILILLFCFTLAFPVYGQQQLARMVISGATSSCDDCSGTLIWSSHFEGTASPFDITTGSPCGCSDNATKTITFNNSMVNSTGQASDGSYSIYRAAATSYADSPLTTTSTTVFSVKFDLYVSTWVNDYQIFSIYYDVNNRIYFALTNNDEMGMYFSGNSTSRALITVDWNLSTGQWYTIRAQGRVGTSPYLRMTVNGGSTQTYSTSDNVELTNVPNLLRMGASGSNGQRWYIDNMQIWQDWQTGAVWGD